MKRKPSIQLSRYATVATTSVAAVVGLYGISQVYAQDQQNHHSSSDSTMHDNHKGIIEVDLLDKIASKPYLTYHNVISGKEPSLLSSTTLDITPRRFVWGNKQSRYESASTKYLHENEEREFKKLIELVASSSSKTYKQQREYIHERPKGIPKRLRVLAIDVPRFKDVFDGECATTSRMFLDDIAPSKQIVHSYRDKKAPSMQVIQKSMAQSLVRCRDKQTKKIGVEIMEASLGYRLNPHNMRRTYQVGTYNYDPSKNKSNEEDDVVDDDDDDGGTPKDKIQTQQSIHHRKRLVTKENILPTNEKDHTSSHQIHTVVAEQEDEIYAPWHQYAWIEEMELRIHGQIPFGAPMEPSTSFHRYMFGNSYKSLVPSLRPWYNWFTPSFLRKGIYAYRGIDSDGMDGDHGTYNDKGLNRASCKPHVVIADASSLQRVPGSLRYLIKCCKEADVPLFIMNDHRVWAGNTHHDDLKSIALDVRSTIKARMVSRALLIKEGGMFERGRILGQLETEAKWQAKELGRRTRQAMQDAFTRHKKEREDDWSTLGKEELEQRFIDRKLIMKSNKTVTEVDGERVMEECYHSKGFLEVCRHCLSTEKTT